MSLRRLENQQLRLAKYCRISALGLIISGLLGCSATNNEPSFDQLALDAKGGYQTWNKQQDAGEANQLTDLIAIPELRELVNRAMDQNPSLQQTAIAVKIAYEQKGITNSGRLPQVSAGLTSDNSEDQEVSYKGNITVSWELDLWQKLTDEVRVAELDLASSSVNYQGAKDLLAANVMRSWLKINLQQQLVEIEQARLKSQEANEMFILERYRSGLGDLEGLDSARTNSATTRSTLAAYHEDLVRERRNLSLLLGYTANSELLAISAEFPSVLQPLARLPEQDLGRRPDLQSAYFAIQAQQHRTDIAYKSLLPSINLTASLTDIASNPSDALFGSSAWQLLSSVTMPLFQGGKLRSDIQVAKLTTEQKYWAYQETLLSAVNEVENALSNETSLSRQQTHLQDALKSATRNTANYETKYRQGLVNILDLLSVQQQSFDVQSKLVTTQYNRLANRIDLGLALGLGVSS